MDFALRQVALIEALHEHLKGKLASSSTMSLGAALQGQGGYGGVCGDGDGMFLRTALLYLSSQEVSGVGFVCLGVISNIVRRPEGRNNVPRRLADQSLRVGKHTFVMGVCSGTMIRPNGIPAIQYREAGTSSQIPEVLSCRWFD